ncbi:MAG: magnesium transporter [Halothiobacillaceae bacterium]|nr:MAG: magnesium transporter [Halothiobacillaceae bacterium]
MEENTRALLDTAHAHLSTDVPVVHPLETAAVIREHLRDRHYESVTHLAVCERDHFLGLIRIKDLLPAPAEITARELMDADPPIVAPGMDQEMAAWHAVQHEETALAVVDAERRFLGLILGHRLLAILLAEHEEDLARVGGFLKQNSRARQTSEEPVLQRFLHRLPWLLLGLAGAILAARIVGGFERQLHELVLLAFFVPSIVYLADAVGTQTETVVVRGLSLGIPIRRVIARELLTGLMIGITLALVAWPVIGWLWGDARVAIGVALSIFAASSVASMIAMILPWAFDKLDIDPAFGSGPLATVIQDLLSILIYFAIVTAVVL